MVCYIVPLIATLFAFIGRRASHNAGRHSFWLSIMLLGGALFGFIDHLWNGELFLIGANWVSDLALGVTITIGITSAWGIISFRTHITDSLHRLNCRLGFLKK